jgi:hypothetical protein
MAALQVLQARWWMGGSQHRQRTPIRLFRPFSPKLSPLRHAKRVSDMQHASDIPRDLPHVNAYGQRI